MDNEERLCNRDDLKHAEEFYETKLAPNLSREEKEELRQQLQERIKQQLCRRKGKYTRCIYPASDFPKLKSTGKWTILPISNLYPFT